MRNCVHSSAVVGLLIVLGVGRAAGPAQEAIPVDLKSFKFKVKPEMESLFGYNEGEDKLFFYTNGPAEATVKIGADGEYVVSVKASCDSAKDERAKFKVSIDGQAVGKETLLVADEEKEYKLTAKLKAGDRKLVIAFTNDVYKESEYDRNLYVHAVRLTPVK